MTGKTARLIFAAALVAAGCKVPTPTSAPAEVQSDWQYNNDTDIVTGKTAHYALAGDSTSNLGVHIHKADGSATGCYIHVRAERSEERIASMLPEAASVGESKSVQYRFDYEKSPHEETWNHKNGNLWPPDCERFISRIKKAHALYFRWDDNVEGTNVVETKTESFNVSGLKWNY